MSIFSSKFTLAAALAPNNPCILYYFCKRTPNLSRLSTPSPSQLLSLSLPATVAGVRPLDGLKSSAATIGQDFPALAHVPLSFIHHSNLNPSNRLKLEMDGEELTEQETALYDRQIRVWGADAQRRLSKAHILVSGLKGTVAEFCKNIVLAGVGSLTLMDDRPVTEESLSANFLIASDQDVSSGKSLAELCCDSLKDFNPMVRVSVEKGDLSSFGGDFYNKFDVVVVSCCSLTAKKSINEKCRKLSKRVAFYSVDCRDSCGEIFIDLQNFAYSKKKVDETVECQLQYPSFEEAIAVPWKSLPKRMSKLYFAMRVIEMFEEAEGRNPGQTSIEDLPKVLKLRKEALEEHSLNESLIPDSLLERLLEGTREFPPVCAIIGGILGQEVIKAISGKGDPLKNFFFFDATDGKGVIEDMSNLTT